MLNMKVSADALRKLLDYDPVTGNFRWRAQKGRAKRGDLAGCKAKNKAGYRWLQIRVDGCLYPAHRLAWLHYYGVVPSAEIDHINQNALDNRISNLRMASRLVNSRNIPRKRNNTSGVTGVYWCGQTSKWRAEVKVDGKKHRLGRFEKITQAEVAVKSFRRLHGFHANHGQERQLSEA